MDLLILCAEERPGFYIRMISVSYGIVTRARERELVGREEQDISLYKERVVWQIISANLS